MPAQSRSILVLLALVLTASLAMQWWGHSREQDLGRQMAAAARPGDIRMLSSLTCAYCAQARQWLTEHRIRHDECFIERDVQCRALYDATQARGTPTLIVKGQVLLGFDAARVAAALAL